MKSTSVKRQSGAVSLFVVIIAMLLISVVTIGFLRLMISNQIQATNNDLSQSAFDSAQAGVEDAKRALLRYQEKCLQGTDATCGADLANFSKCNAANASVVESGAIGQGRDDTSVGEIKIQQTASATNDDILNQAYTCVTAQLNTDDYVGTLSPNSSQLIPLIATAAYNKIAIEWFSLTDVSAGVTGLSIPNTPGAQRLSEEWPTNRPSVLRAQFMQVGSSFTLNSFDTTTTSGQSNVNTVFLYPHANGIVSNAVTPIELITRDVRSNDTTQEHPRPTPENTPLPISCKATLASGGYACSATIQLPEPVSGTSANRIAYLRLTAFYNGTHFRVTIPDTDSRFIQFNGVQPIVDSTGRANDLFRRVQSRIDMYDTSFPYPDAAVDVSGNFCKDFGVTNDAYIGSSNDSCKDE